VNWHTGQGRDTIAVSYATFLRGCGDGESGQIADLFARKLSSYSGILSPSNMGRLSILER